MVDRQRSTCIPVGRFRTWAGGTTRVPGRTRYLGIGTYPATTRHVIKSNRPHSLRALSSLVEKEKRDLSESLIENIVQSKAWIPSFGRSCMKWYWHPGSIIMRVSKQESRETKRVFGDRQGRSQWRSFFYTASRMFCLLGSRGLVF
jgi:hypothetical protein